MIQEKSLIRCESEQAWLAAIIDGEGSIYLAKGSPTIEVSSIDIELLEHIIAITKYGKISTKKKRFENQKQPYIWRCYGKSAVKILRAVYRFLIIKANQATLCHTLQYINDNKIKDVPDDYKNQLHKLVQKFNQREKAELPNWVVFPSI